MGYIWKCPSKKCGKVVEFVLTPGDPQRICPKCKVRQMVHITPNAKISYESLAGFDWFIPGNGCDNDYPLIIQEPITPEDLKQLAKDE